MSDARGVAGTAPSRRRRLRTLLVRYRVPIGLAAIVVGLRPVLAHPLVLGYGQIANTVLVWMLFAASFNLLLGYTGLLSFGHAMFLGFGAYGTAIGIVRFGLPFSVSALAGVAVAAAVAYVTGRLIARKGEIYFAMLTLAFAEAVHFVANKDYGGLTGGSAGLPGALPTWIESQRGVKLVAVGGLSFDWYYLLAACFFVGCVAIWQLLRSPFGRTLVAVRENERLARSIGVDTARYKVWSLTASGAFAAVAGTLLAVANQGATLETLSIETSGDVILMTILGGANYFVGPLFGAFAWFASEEALTQFGVLALPLAEWPLVRVDLAGVLTYWPFFLGLLFVVTVLIAPREGLWGLLRGGLEAVRDRVWR